MRIRIATIAALLLLMAGVLSAGDAEQFRTDAAGTGATPELIAPIAGPSPLTLLWCLQLPSSEARSSPVVVGSRVYVGSEDGALRCLDLSSGSVLWSFQTGGAIRSTPAYLKGRVAFGSLDGNLYVLHAGTGQVLWSLFHGGAQIGSPMVTSIPGPTDAVYFGVGDPATEIRAYNLIDGSFLWSQSTGQPVTSKPAFYNGATPAVIVGNNVGIWQAYDAVTGVPLWSPAFSAPNGSRYVSAAVAGNRVILCSGGGDRYVHVLDADTGAEIKQVLAVPPGFGKVGGTVNGDVQEFHPETYLDTQTMHGLLNNLDKAARDEEVDAWAVQRGFDAAQMKEWLDLQINDESPPTNGLSAPSGPFWVNLTRGVHSSSVAVDNGIAYVTHREISGKNTDEYFTVAVDIADGVPPSSSVVWGTTPLTETWPDGRVMPSPAVSAGQYLFYAHTKNLHIADAADGTLLGTKDVGDYILGGPTLANGRVLVTTMGGKVCCYAGANSPPLAPTTFNPTGGEKLTGVTMPTIFWSGQSDPESAPGSLKSHLEFAFGLINSDLEISLSKTQITLPAGSSSYMFAPIPSNTHVFYRVRAEDPEGANSGWSTIQDFWIDKDPVPPLPPESVTATGQESAVMVGWSSSPSPDVERYRLRYKLSSQSWPAATLIDGIAASATQHLVTGLINGTSYDFSLTAVDIGENESAAVIVSAKPIAQISIGGLGSFPTIQGALDAAVAGETVILQPGTYVENVVVPPGVGLVGASPGNTILDGGGAAVAIKVNGIYGLDPMTEIARLTVTNAGIGVDTGNADVWLHHVILAGLTGDGIVSGFTGQVLIENCTIADNGGSGVATQTDQTTIISSVVAFNLGYGVNLPVAAAVLYSDLYGNGLGESAGPTVELENINELPVFVDGKYHVEDGSATVDRGDPSAAFANEPSPNGDRINQGAYGNTIEAARSPVAKASPAAKGGGGGGGSGGCSVGTVGASGPTIFPVLAVLLMALMIGIVTRRTVRV